MVELAVIILAYCIAVEELSRVCASTGVTYLHILHLQVGQFINLDRRAKTKIFTSDGSR